MKNTVLLIALIMSLSCVYSQKGFKTDLVIDSLSPNHSLNVVEHEGKFYTHSQHFDSEIGVWNMAMVVLDANGNLIDRKFLRNDTVALPSFINHANYDGETYSIIGTKRGMNSIMTYDFIRDTFYTSEQILLTKTKTSGSAMEIDPVTGAKYVIGGNVRFSPSDPLLFQFKVYKILESDTLFYIYEDDDKQVRSRNARINHDGNLVVVGTNSFGNGYQNQDSSFIAIFDPDLNLISSTLFSNEQAPARVYKGMCIDSRNEIVCTHEKRALIDTTLQVSDPNNDNLLIPGMMKFDEEGKHLWTVDIGNNINNTSFYGTWEAVIESQEKDGYIIAGSESYLSERRDTLLASAALAKVSLDGDSLWMRRYSYEREGAVAADEFNDVYPTSDGGYIAVGRSSGYRTVGVDSPSLYSIILKVDSEGRLDTATTSVITVDEQEDSILIFPNPSSGRVCIQQEGQEFYNAELLSPSGQLIKKFELLADNHHVILSSDTFSESGMYLLRLRNKQGEIKAKKIVVER